MVENPGRNILARLHKDRVKIMVSNTTNKTLKISRDKPIAMLNTDISKQLLAPVTHIDKTDKSTIMYANKADIKADYMSNSCKVQGLAKTNTACNVIYNKLSSSQLLYQQKCGMYPYLDHNDPRLRLTDEHIIEMDIDLSNSIMSEGYKLKLHEILIHERQSLSIHGEVGNCPDFEVDFELEDYTPFYIRPYKVSEQDKEKIDESLCKIGKDECLEEGVDRL